MVSRDRWDNVVVVTRDNGTEAVWDGRVKNLIYDTDSMTWIAQGPATSSGGGGGDATAANQVTGNTSLASIDSKTPALTSGRVPVDGSGVVQPVSGPLTDTQLRASAVPVSGPLTDAELRASAVPVSASSLPLPTGASTSANQTTANSSLSSIDSKLSGTLAVSGPLTDTQLRATAVPVSAASLPLPSGAATSALQTAGNQSLTYIDGHFTSLKALTGEASPSTYNIMVGGYYPGPVAPAFAGAAQYPIRLDAQGRVVIRGLTSSTDTVAATQSGTWTVQPGNTANTTAWLMKIDQTAANNNSVSLGNSIGKSNILRTGSLVTTTTTADQVILTYTVTIGKIFYMTYWDVTARLTTFAATATNFGTASLENPSVSKFATVMVAHAGTPQLTAGVRFTEPVPFLAGTTIRIVCTPAATTSFTWQANFGGYEK